MNPRPSPFRNGFNSRELRDLFQQGLIHIVAPAVYGKSNFPVALSLCDRANPAHMAAWSRGREVADQANAEGRCVSLLPDLPLTAMPTHRTCSDAEAKPIDTHRADIETNLSQVFEIHLQWLRDLWLKENRMIVPPILFALDQEGTFDVSGTVRAIQRLCRRPEHREQWEHSMNHDRFDSQLQIFIEAPRF